LNLLLDEKHELVLGVLDPSGAPKVVQPIDTLRLIEVNDRGLFRLRLRTWGLLGLGSLPWWPVLYDFLT
jgi:hypothetical protein